MHFVKVPLFSFDDEWIGGSRVGGELWITEPVGSEPTLGEV